MAYEDYCASCTYQGEREDYDGKYWCERKGRSVYACDAKCYDWIEAYSRSNYSRENMYYNSRKHQSSGCYLTTAMCNILGYKDDNYYLNTLRTFRDKTLKKNHKYIHLLLMYDAFGPLIANNLKNDPNNKDIATHLFNGYITKAVTAIENEKVEEAVNIYIAMTYTLAERYNINMHTLFIDEESIKLKTINTQPLGKGRIRTKKLEGSI